MIDITQIKRIELDLVDYCNLSCPGCPTPQGKTKLDWDIVLPFIETISKKNIIDDITICGNGGEPLLHPKITEIILDLYKLFPNTKITLATNGEFFKYFNIEKLQSIGKNLLIEWSIDGHTNEIHTITRKNGNLEKVIKNYNIYSKYFDNIIFTSRHKFNENYIKEINDFIFKNCDQNTNFRDTTRVEISSNLFHPTKHSKNSNVKILNSGTKQKSFKLLEKIFNIEPLFNFYINPDNRVYPCAAFYYNKIEIPKLFITDPLLTYNKFQIFSNEYCKFHRENTDCDHTRCCLECGIDKDYSFDKIEDLL